MFDKINFELGSLIFVVLSLIVLTVIVFYHNKKSASNIIFTLLALSFGVWSVINYFSVYNPFVGADLFWIRLVLFSAAPQAFLFALLMKVFPKKQLKFNRVVLLNFIVLLLTQMFLALTPYVFKSVNYESGGPVPVPGVGMFFYASVLVFFFVYGIYLLIKKTYLAKGKEKQAMMVIFSGFVMMIFLLLFFLFFAVTILKNTNFISYSHLFIIPFVLSMAYVLTKHKFLNIKLIATEFLVGLMTIVILTEALLSGSILSIIWKLLFSLFIAFMGILLVRSVRREIEQKEQLRIANIRLKELDKQKTEFLSVASHQLRTPLSIAKGYLELLKDNAYGKITKEMDGIFNNMSVANEHLIKLIDEFLDISRIEQGRTKYNFEDASLQDVASDVYMELGKRANDRGLKLIYKSNKNLPIINIDKEKIRHVIFNYVDNAIKYTPKGEIKILVNTHDDGLRVQVQDTGLGFGKIDEVNFFQKFYRGSNAAPSGIPGTGLGIYVCKKFIEKHGGEVWAKSKGLDKGSEFGFWIPIKPTKK